MKVLCINDSGWIQANRDNPKRSNSGPAYGEFHIVIDVDVFKNLRYYRLEAWPGHQFLAAAFIRVQDGEEESEEMIPISEIHKYSPWPTDKAITTKL